MEAMQKQMEGFIANLNEELRQRVMSGRFGEANNNSLMPVIEISAMAGAGRGVEGKKRK
jgi:hypothetical protein